MKKYFFPLLMILFPIFNDQSVQAASFIDTFEDGIVNSLLYEEVSTAQITEESGSMSVFMDNPGEGIEMDFSNLDFDVECFKVIFDGEQFVTGQGISIKFILEDENGQEFLDTTLSILEVESVIANIIIEQDGERIYQGLKKFPDITINKPSQIIQFDLIGGVFRKLRWKVDNDGGIAQDIIEQILNATNQMFPAELARKSKIKKVFFELISDPNPEDPIINFQEIEVNDVHVPEPSSTIGLISLGIIGGGATLKRKLKSANSTKK